MVHNSVSCFQAIAHRMKQHANPDGCKEKSDASNGMGSSKHAQHHGMRSSKNAQRQCSEVSSGEWSTGTKVEVRFIVGKKTRFFVGKVKLNSRGKVTISFDDGEIHVFEHAQLDTSGDARVLVQEAHITRTNMLVHLLKSKPDIAASCPEWQCLFPNSKHVSAFISALNLRMDKLMNADPGSDTRENVQVEIIRIFKKLAKHFSVEDTSLMGSADLLRWVQKICDFEDPLASDKVFDNPDWESLSSEALNPVFQKAGVLAASAAACGESSQSSSPAPLSIENLNSIYLSVYRTDVLKDPFKNPEIVNLLEPLTMYLKLQSEREQALNDQKRVHDPNQTRVQPFYKLDTAGATPIIADVQTVKMDPMFRLHEMASYKILATKFSTLLMDMTSNKFKAVVKNALLLLLSYEIRYLEGPDIVLAGATILNQGAASGPCLF